MVENALKDRAIRLLHRYPSPEQQGGSGLRHAGMQQNSRRGLRGEPLTFVLQSAVAGTKTSFGRALVGFGAVRGVSVI